MVHSFAKVRVTFSLTTYESVPYLSIFTKNCTRVFDTDKTTLGPFFLPTTTLVYLRRCQRLTDFEKKNGVIIRRKALLEQVKLLFILRPSSVYL